MFRLRHERADDGGVDVAVGEEGGHLRFALTFEFNTFAILKCKPFCK